MMNAEALRQRLRGGENLNTEFKAGAIHPDEPAAALVAFANTSGGAIIFGASDKGEIIGVENIDALGKTIDNVARHNCLPAVTLVPEKIELENKNLLVVETMRLGTHVPRHPILLSQLAKLGYVTSLGTGVPRVIRLVSQAVGKEPDIVVRDFEVLVSLSRRT